MSILIVEDDSVSATIISTSLQRREFTTIRAATAHEARAMLEEDPAVQLVLLDIGLPDFDGLTLLNMLRERPEWSELPVIVCSGITDQETLGKARFLGVKAVIGKPVNIPELLETVQKVLAAEPVVLQDRLHCLLRLGVDAALYQELVRAFADLLETRLAGSDPSVASDARMRLVDLLDGAQLLGAARLESAIQRVQSDSTISNNGAQRIIIPELRLLRAALQQELDRD